MTASTLELFECSPNGAIGKRTGEQFTVPAYHVDPLRRVVGLGQLTGAVHFAGAIAYVVQFPWMVRRVLFNFGKY